MTEEDTRCIILLGFLIAALLVTLLIDVLLVTTNFLLTALGLAVAFGVNAVGTDIDSFLTIGAAVVGLPVASLVTCYVGEWR